MSGAPITDPAPSATLADVVAGLAAIQQSLDALAAAVRGAPGVQSPSPLPAQAAPLRQS